MKKTLLIIVSLLTLFAGQAQLIIEEPDLTKSFTLEFPDLENNDFGNLYGKSSYSTKMVIKRAAAGTEVALNFYNMFYDTLPFGDVVIDDYNWYGNFNHTFFFLSENDIVFSETDTLKEVTLSISPANFTYQNIVKREICYKYSGLTCTDKRWTTYAAGDVLNSTLEGLYMGRVMFFIDNTSGQELYSPTIKASYNETEAGVGFADNIQESLAVYPNPVQDKLVLPSITTWTLTNANGVDVLQGNGEEVNVENMQSGIYYIRTSDNQSAKILKK